MKHKKHEWNGRENEPKLGGWYECKEEGKRGVKYMRWIPGGWWEGVGGNEYLIRAEGEYLWRMPCRGGVGVEEPRGGKPIKNSDWS